MKNTPRTENNTTGHGQGGFRGRGKGSAQKRIDAFMQKKNQEADDAIMAGIFQRLKITDPTTVLKEPLAIETNTVVAPIKLSTVPTYLVNIQGLNLARKRKRVASELEGKIPELYTWDRGNQLTYPVRYHEMGYKYSARDDKHESMESVEAQMQTGFEVQHHTSNG